jgi:hypothetical protein
MEHDRKLLGRQIRRVEVFLDDCGFCTLLKLSIVETIIRETKDGVV